MRDFAVWLELPFPEGVSEGEGDRRMEEIADMDLPHKEAVVRVENHGALGPDPDDPDDTEPVVGVLCIPLECESLEEARKAADDIMRYYREHTECRNIRLVTVEEI